MSHKTRAEQRAIKARKDPRKIAWKTKAHKPKTAYKRCTSRLIAEALEEANNE
jgi:ribosomal protein L24E